MKWIIAVVVIVGFVLYCMAASNKGEDELEALYEWQREHGLDGKP